jgi:stage V sporulation protein D (sporulation-specific penicillin-binding protein)
MINLCLTSRQSGQRQGTELMRKQKRNTYFKRDRWVQLLLAVLMLVVVGRLIDLQVVQASALQEKGIERRTNEQNLLPQRGTILDAQGNVLAQSVPVKEVYADPKMLTDLITKKQFKNTKEEVAIEIGKILEIEPQKILADLNKNLSWISLAHQVDVQKADQIMALKIPGFGLNDEQKRVNPMGIFASSSLGIVNQEDHGVEGIESYYDKELFGKPGFVAQEEDTRARSIMGAPSQNQPPIPGNNLTLTLDSTIQYLIEQQLDSLQQSTKPKSVTILAMDPKTGRVLGMASRPSFDPSKYKKVPPETRRNLAISMTYEPGSTFKTITGSAALEEGVISPNETFFDPGYLQVGPRVITNWDSNQAARGNTTFTQGMQSSSNVVLAQVGMRLGMNAFYTYLKAFGFGSKTGIDISGEESGIIVPQDKARELELATMSFGQANSVTPIQLLTAVSAIANGGTLYKPYIVDKITTPDGQLVEQHNPTPIRQVLSKQTTSQMTEVLEKVVENGTGYLAKIPGINVAGKTGTAQKIDPKTGDYSANDYIASFVSYAPAEDPKIALLIIIDTPKMEDGQHDGGPLCGPPAKAILEGALQYYGIPVSDNTQSVVSISPSDTAVRPSPKPVTPEHTPTAEETVVPDLTGLTMRQVGTALEKSELHFSFSGSGLANQQSLAPGKVVPKGTDIDVKFSSLSSP